MKPVIIIAIAFVLLIPISVFAEPEQKVCTAQYDPVCGISGKTFSNMCELESAGGIFDYQGKCVGSEPELKRKILCEDGTIDIDGICQVEPIEEEEKKIPEWVKKIFLWYGQDLVSEDELLNAIKYLITEGILIIPPEQQTQIDPPSLEIDAGPSDDTIETTQSSALCSGNARCITGVVTKVIDGDTIKVDGQSIRFALASAPELGGYGAGVKETEFIQKICPVGSSVLVDEDDKQTQGSYGRIIGVVYCNGMNLNSELLDADLGYMDFKFCDISEFGNSDWAIKHGCKSKVTTQTHNNCDPSYPDFCIPPSPPDLDCGDIPQKRFTVLQPDPHRFDGDKDGIGCES